MMKFAQTIVPLFVVAGGLSVAACAPPTPKVDPSVVPPVIEREPVTPVGNSDGSFRRTV